MKTSVSIFLLFVVGIVQLSCAQENTKEPEIFPFTQSNWTVVMADGSEGTVNTLEYKGKQALQLEKSQIAYLKGRKFKNFVLDFYCNGLAGPGFGFRLKDRKNYEYLYLRLGLSGRNDALQYLPIYNGSLPWQLYNYPKYEGKATFYRDTVTTLDISFSDELIKGKASERLRNALSRKGFSFSEASEVDFVNRVTAYILDLKEMRVLLFNEGNNEISVLDIRTWLHVRVRVEGDIASFYIGDMETPALTVENLKRDAIAGGLSLIGDEAGAYFSDVTITEIKENESLGGSHKEKLPEGYLTKWNISEMFAKDSIDFCSQVDSGFKSKFKLRRIEADEDGLINISRYNDDMTKTVALSCNLISDRDQRLKLNFDYADHLVVLLDSKVLFDKGMNFQPPEGKGEEGRVFVDDEQVELDLKRGDNLLIFLLSADDRQKFNWGFIAKLEHLEGINVGL